MDLVRKLEEAIALKDKNQIYTSYGPYFYDYILEEIGTKNVDLWTYFIEMFVEQIDFGKRMLDFGSGFGIEAMLLSQYIQKVIALDVNEHKISVCKKLLKELKISNVFPEVGNGEKMPYKDNTFGSVFCNESISHVQDVKKAFSEIKRVLKPGGKVVIADTKKWNMYGIYMIYIRNDKDENYFTVSVMKELLHESGYEDIERIKYITAPRQPLRKWRKAFWSLLQLADPKYVLVGYKGKK